MAVTAWLANYPFSDPIFQFFQVQQYLTVSGVNPTQTYSEHAPVKEVAEPVKKSKVDLEKELSELKKAEGVSEDEVKKIVADVEAGEGDAVSKLEEAVARVKARLEDKKAGK